MSNVPEVLLPNLRKILSTIEETGHPTIKECSGLVICRGCNCCDCCLHPAATGSYSDCIAWRINDWCLDSRRNRAIGELYRIILEAIAELEALQED